MHAGGGRETGNLFGVALTELKQGQANVPSLDRMRHVGTSQKGKLGSINESLVITAS